jgi:hypothetical protein
VATWKDFVCQSILDFCWLFFDRDIAPSPFWVRYELDCDDEVRFRIDLKIWNQWARPSQLFHLDCEDEYLSAENEDRTQQSETLTHSWPSTIQIGIEKMMHLSVITMMFGYLIAKEHQIRHSLLW